LDPTCPDGGLSLLKALVGRNLLLDDDCFASNPR
jgi:hypothetical protein